MPKEKLGEPTKKPKEEQVKADEKMVKEYAKTEEAKENKGGAK